MLWTHLVVVFHVSCCSEVKRHQSSCVDGLNTGNFINTCPMYRHTRAE